MSDDLDGGDEPGSDPLSDNDDDNRDEDDAYNYDEEGEGEDEGDGEMDDDGDRLAVAPMDLAQDGGAAGGGHRADVHLTDLEQIAYRDEDGDAKMGYDPAASRSSSSSSAAVSASASASASAAAGGGGHDSAAERLRLAQMRSMKTNAEAVYASMKANRMSKEDQLMRLRQIERQVTDIRTLEDGRYADRSTNNNAKPMTLQNEASDRVPQMDTLVEILTEDLGRMVIRAPGFGDIDDPRLVSEAIHAGHYNVPIWDAGHVQSLYTESGTHVISRRFLPEGKGDEVVRLCLPCRHGEQCVFLHHARRADQFGEAFAANLCTHARGAACSNDKACTAAVARPMMVYMSPAEYEQFIRGERMDELYRKISGRPCIMCLVKSISANIQKIRSEEATGHRGGLIATVVFGVKTNQQGGFYANCVYEATLPNKRPSGLNAPVLDGITRGMSLQKDGHDRLFMDLDKLIWKHPNFGNKPVSVDIQLTQSVSDKWTEAAAAAQNTFDEQRQRFRASLEVKAGRGAHDSAGAGGGGENHKPVGKPIDEKKKLAADTAAASIATTKTQMVARMIVSASDREATAPASASASASAVSGDPTLLKLNF